MKQCHGLHPVCGPPVENPCLKATLPAAPKRRRRERDLDSGSRCKCNGHASECIANEADQLVCFCQHNTAGVDCEMCQPFYRDRPWARGTAESANECLSCNCSGRSEECFYDWELYRSTGHGGRCQNCSGNTDGPHCESCRENFYRWDSHVACQPCSCNTAGSLNLQCDSSGTCECKATVTGWKCERCQDGFHSFSEGGCSPCMCDPVGSVGTCDSNTGKCTCKQKVEGYLCDRCQPGSFNLQPNNPAGCTSCFCYGHSTACTASPGYEVHHIVSNFSEGADGWTVENPTGKEMLLRWSDGQISLEQSGQETVDFLAPEKFLHDRRLSYGQLLSADFLFEGNETDPQTPHIVWLVLEGDGILASATHSVAANSRNITGHEYRVTTFRLHEAEGEMRPALTPFQFQHLLSNLSILRLRVESGQNLRQISLKEVRLLSARPGFSQPALWVEECICPQGYVGQFCDSCAPGFTRDVPFGGPLSSCVPCSCNQHGSCDPGTGLCQCLHNTEGPSCERCTNGFYGNPFVGRFDDCKPCPCPEHSPCATIPESGEVVCTHCPPRQRGRFCELCDDGFFGDPLGKNGPVRPCEPCGCNANVDPNAVGNCDALSGQCLRCIYNTSGHHCEKCQEGFYGNPLATSPSPKCLPCECNPRGSSTHGPEVCDNVTGLCSCLLHVTGRDCNRCEDGYFNLQPEKGCQSCQCHTMGAQHDRCHPVTGQCACHPGVEGLLCDRCRTGFFGFAFHGCRACNCSQLGSVSVQCYENSTCICKKGFVGYKCDQCEANYFYDSVSSRCQECPLCFGLVKEEADKLKAMLTEMELRLQKPSCGRTREDYSYALLGEAPRGDSLHNQYLLKGGKMAFLEETAELEKMVNEAQISLRKATGLIDCDSPTMKACVLFSDVQSALWSTHREIQLATETLDAMEFPPKFYPQPANWSYAAVESRSLSRSHVEAAALVEDIAKKALYMSNTSYLLLQSIIEDDTLLGFRRQMEERYQKIEKAQEEFDSKIGETTDKAKETLASIHQTNTGMAKNLSWTPILELRFLGDQAEKLNQGVSELEQEVELKGQLAVNGSFAVKVGLQSDIQRMEQLEQHWQRAKATHILASSACSNGEAVMSEANTLLSSLDGMKKVILHHNKAQSPTKRRMTIVRDRTLEDAQKRIRQVQRNLGDSAPVSAKAQKTAVDAELMAKESAELAENVLRRAKQEKRRAGKLKTQVTLTRKALSHQERESEDVGNKLGQASEVAVEMNHLGQHLHDAHRSLKQDIATLNDLLASLGDPSHAGLSEAVLNSTWTQLENLQAHLTEPSATVALKLSGLQLEAEQQQLRIEAFEKDLEEIQRDKQNLEAILLTLPKGCSSWK